VDVRGLGTPFELWTRTRLGALGSGTSNSGASGKSQIFSGTGGRWTFDDVALSRIGRSRNHTARTGEITQPNRTEQKSDSLHPPPHFSPKGEPASMGAFSAEEGEDAVGGTLLTREAARMEVKEAWKQPSKESRSEGPGLRTSLHRWNCGLYGNPAKEDQDIGPPQDLVDSAGGCSPSPDRTASTPSLCRHRRTGDVLLPPRNCRTGRHSLHA
jgi:hypothetical protein